MKNLLERIEKAALAGTGMSREDALEFIRIPDERVFDILPHTERIRRRFKGDGVNLCSIVNAKSGLCAEDCSFCSQSSHYPTSVKSYPMKSAASIVDAARKAELSGSNEFSIVTSGTGVDDEVEIETLSTALAQMKRSTDLETCASLGIMNADKLKALKEAGLESYHHNLETSRSFFPSICTTHAYDDDVNTVRLAKKLDFHVCSGGLFGLGESFEQRIELAETLRELDVDSVPVNFLDARPGTPLENKSSLTARECLRIIALLRFMLPQKDIVVCGGRPKNLRDLTPLIFAAGANGLMVGDYLTTPGRKIEDDMRMLEDLGLRPAREKK